MRTTLKRVVALAAVTAAWFTAADALAFGHRGHGSSGGSSGGSYGSWGSSGGSWGSSGGSSGGYTVYRHRWHGSSGGSYGSWGSSGGSWGSSGGSYYYGGSSGGSSGGWGSSGGSSGGVIYSESPSDSAPATPSAPSPSDANGKSASIGNGMLLVKVPADAKIFVNGKATTSIGADRQYVSRGLVRGASYNFEVKAEMIRGGQPVTITKNAKLTAGSNVQLAFDELADEPDSVVTAKPVTTTLVVKVPADAKVFLAGNETKQTGEVREFTTNKLTAGDGWTDYTIRAEVEQDGKLLSKEQIVSIKAGESKEISFDFAGGANEEPIAETAKK